MNLVDTIIVDADGMTLQQRIAWTAKPYEELLMHLIALDLRVLRCGISKYHWGIDPICELDLCGDLRKQGREVARQRDNAVEDIRRLWVARFILNTEGAQ